MNWKKRLKYIKYIFRKIHKPFHHRLRIFCTDTHNAAVGNTECKPLFVYKRTPHAIHPFANHLDTMSSLREQRKWSLKFGMCKFVCGTRCVSTFMMAHLAPCSVNSTEFKVGNFDVNSCHWSTANWYNCNLWGAGRSVESNIIKANAVLNILNNKNNPFFCCT